MKKQIKIKQIVTVILISFVIMAGNLQREASAFTIKQEVDISDSFLTLLNDSLPVFLNQYEGDQSLRNSDEDKTLIFSGHESFPGGRRSEFILIEGDFSIPGLDHSDRFSHFTDDRDDLKQIPSPSPVPLPATALLLGTGLAVLAGLTSRKEFSS